MQVTYGLLCAADGCPVAVEVFAGNAGDPSTVAAQVDKVRKRFGIGRVALVGDRGMLTTARIREDLEPAGLDWISALKTGDIRKLLKAGAGGAPAPLAPEALVPDAVAEVTGPDFPGERLMVCLNPRLREERRRKREDLLKATEETLAEIAAAAARRKPGPANRDRTIKALGREANRRKMEKHFDIEVHDAGMDWARNRDRIAAEARLDGVYVVRTSLDSASFGPEAAVEAYKSLALVDNSLRICLHRFKGVFPRPCPMPSRVLPLVAPRPRAVPSAAPPRSRPQGSASVRFLPSGGPRRHLSSPNCTRSAPAFRAGRRTRRSSTRAASDRPAAARDAARPWPVAGTC